MDMPTPAAPDPRKNEPVNRNYALGAVGGLLMILSFAAGVFVSDLRRSPQKEEPSGEGQVMNKDAPPPYELQDVDFQAFWEVWRTVKQRYVEQPIPDVKLFYGAMAGLVGSLEDPYSVFFDPESAAKFTRELGGEFEGIGAEIGIKKNQVTVIAPLPGTPAEKAGIRAGDRVLAIDGVDTTGMFIEDAVSRIRGPKGSQVKLLVIREGLDEPLEIVITRDVIVVDSVKWTVDKVETKRIVRITISHFNENTEGKFNEAVRDILLEEPDGIILDLRNNPGGFLETAVAVAGEWVPRDIIVIEQFSDGTKKNYASDGGARLADVATVVMINEGSASASEIVAGALQDYGKARVVGEKSYGKGSVQDYTEYEDGSALKLTVASWLTPKGRTINKEGIVPDVVVVMTPEDFSEDRDPQLDKAREMFITPLPVPAPPEAPATEPAR